MSDDGLNSFDYRVFRAIKSSQGLDVNGVMTALGLPESKRLAVLVSLRKLTGLGRIVKGDDGLWYLNLLLPDPSRSWSAAFGKNDPETSSMDLELDEPGFATQRQLILDALYYNPEGLNNTELGCIIGRNVSTAACRTRELRETGWMQWLDPITGLPVWRQASGNRKGRAQWLTPSGRQQWKQRIKVED